MLVLLAVAGSGCYDFRGGAADAAVATTDDGHGDATGDRPSFMADRSQGDADPRIDIAEVSTLGEDVLPDVGEVDAMGVDVDGPDVADAKTLPADGGGIDVLEAGVQLRDVVSDMGGFDTSRDDRPEVVDAPDAIAAREDVVVPADVAPTACSAGQTRCGERCVDTGVSPANCGMCGLACPDRANATAACAAGRCRLVCVVGYEDCDGDASNGCESRLASIDTCGACGNRCREPTPFCQAIGGGYACVSGCGGAASTRCAMSCVDPRSDVRHCGGCDRVCPVPAEGRATCDAGACGLVCNAGRHLCGTGCADDTAVATCGSRCEPCPARANATSTCSMGSCGFNCREGFVDCDGDASNGCEADTRSSAANCGACGTRCPSGVGCAAGTCAPFVAVAAGNRHTCAVRSDGTVWCWGRNNEGQLGDGTTNNRARPVAVATLTDIAAIGLGSQHSCALRRDGTIACWGTGLRGELGDGTLANRATVGSVPGVSNARAVAGGGGHTCVALLDGSVRCWGANYNGQVGDGTAGNNRPTPVAVAGVSRATDVTAGSSHTCALIDDGSLRCWGYGAHGQLGDAATTGLRTAPVTPPLSDVIEVASGDFHTCARTRDLRAWCWGWNAYGEVGVSSGENLATPVLLSALGTTTRIEAGNGNSCAVSSRRVSCWGKNANGELGDGTTSPRSTPAPLATVIDLVAVAIGGAHACALDPQGAVYCWGLNDSGQLGDGTTANRTTPTRVEVP